MPGKWRRAARSGNDHLNPLACRFFREFGHEIRRPMRTHDLRRVRDSKLLQHLGSMLHRVPIGLAAHDDGDERFEFH
jgi:hypothetical protein